MKKIFVLVFFLNLSFLTFGQATTTFVQSEDLATNLPEAITFNNDGTRMFVIDDSLMVETYTLTTGFDISTRSFSVALAFDLAPTNPSPRGIVFNSDGTKMIISNAAIDIIENYNLAVAFNPSTAGLLGTHDTSGEVSSERGVVFNNDGTKVYVVEASAPHEVTEYDLGLAYDITTVDGNRSFGFGDQVGTGNVEAIRFNNDGTKLFTVGKTGSEAFVWEYALGTAFDVSTASYTDNFSVDSQDNDPRGLAFNADGTKMFIVGNQNDKVYEYSLSTGFDLNVAAGSGGDGGDSGGDGALSDPTNDAEVVGSIDAQSQSVKNSISNSINSVSNRLSNIRQNKSNQSSQNIKLDFGNAILTSLSNDLLAKNDKSLLPDNWSSWSEGSISVIKIGDSTNSSSKEIDSHGLALGFDTKLNNNDTLGFAIQYGQSDADIGSNGTNSDSENYNLSVYRTRPLDDNQFIEGIFGVGAIESDLTRVSGANTLTGSRDGTQVYGSVNYGKKIDKGEFSLTPIGRVDLGYTELDAYNETGTNALSYDKQNIESGVASLGVEIDNIIKFSNSSLKPFGSLEYGLDFSNSSDAKMNYVSDTSTSYTHTKGANSNNLITSVIGFEFMTEDNLNILTSYKRIQGDESEHTDMVNVSLNFKSKQETNYAMSLDGSEDLKAGFDVTKKVNGFDLSFNADQSLSENSDQTANVSLSRKF